MLHDKSQPKKIENMFSVYFSGKLIDGFSVKHAAKNLENTSNIPIQYAEKLLARSNISIKKNVTKQHAQTILRAMTQCGLNCYIREEDDIQSDNLAISKHKHFSSTKATNHQTIIQTINNTNNTDKYSIYISEKVLSGFTYADVINNLKTRLNISNKAIHVILQSKDRPLKKGLTEEQANKIVQKFSECGLDCYKQCESVKIVEIIQEKTASTDSSNETKLFQKPKASSTHSKHYLRKLLFFVPGFFSKSVFSRFTMSLGVVQK